MTLPEEEKNVRLYFSFFPNAAQDPRVFAFAPSALSRGKLYIRDDGHFDFAARVLIKLSSSTSLLTSRKILLVVPQNFVLEMLEKHLVIKIKTQYDIWFMNIRQ